jgi:hypothetical protein
MRVPKIYLETTVFNWYCEEDRGDAHTSTVELFREIAAGQFEPYTSGYVVKELVQTANIERREKMLSLIDQYGVTILPEEKKAEQLADEYVAEGIIPVKYRTDGLHIAAATVNDIDIIVSMNFQHIAKRKTKTAVPALNILRGYKTVEIYSPMEVINSEVVE